MKNLLHKITNKVFNAFQAYNALNKQVLPINKMKINSLLIGYTKQHSDFLPSKTWQWFSSLKTE